MADRDWNAELEKWKALALKHAARIGLSERDVDRAIALERDTVHTQAEVCKRLSRRWEERGKSKVLK